MARAAWMMSGLLATVALGIGAAVAAAADAGSGPTGRPDASQRRVGDIEGVMETLRQGIWNLPAVLGYPAPHASGRTLQQDIDQYLLTDEVQQAMDARIALLREHGDADQVLSDEDLQDLEYLLAPELCRINAVANFWSPDAAFGYHEELVTILLVRLGESSPGIQGELDNLRSARRRTRAQLEQNLHACDGIVAGDPMTSPLMRDRELATRYRALRERLAAQVEEKIMAGDLTAPDMDRPQPCPAPEPATGPDRELRVRSMPPVAAYYPNEMRRHGIEGIVRVQLDYDVGGCVWRAQVISGSGADALDEAAMRVALEVLLEPAVVDGVALDGSATLPIRFSLRAFDDQPQP